MGHSVTYLNRLSSTGFSHSGIETVGTWRWTKRNYPPKKPLYSPLPTHELKKKEVDKSRDFFITGAFPGSLLMTWLVQRALERYLIWFYYFQYGTRLFNGTSRQQAYSCMWPSTRLIPGAKGWTNSRGLVHWGQHHMKPLALPFVGLWMEYGWKVGLASLVNRPWLVFSLVPTAIELRYLYSGNKTDLHEDHILFRIRSDISTLRFNYIWLK